MNIRKNFSRVVVYNGQYNFDRLKRFVKEDLGDDLETDPSKLLAGVSDQTKRSLMEQRSKLRNQTIVDMADSSSPHYDAKWQARIYNDTTYELPVAQALNESLKALRKKGKKLRGLDLPKEDRRVLLGDAYKVAKENQEVYNTLLARGVASENMPQNLKKK